MTRIISFSAKEAAPILTMAVIRASGMLQITQSSLARILGLSQTTASSLHTGSYLLTPDHPKEWEVALLFIRIFRSVNAIFGPGEAACSWLTMNNTALNGRPAELIESTKGLIRVLHYLDAQTQQA
jgi:DNA-binding XRE family transcriptional regulator